MKKILRTHLLTCAAFAAAPLAFANTPLLEDPGLADTGDTTKWNVGSNTFVGGNYVAFVTDAYTVADRVTASGNGMVFSSWDDNASDRIETFLYQEWGAGPAAPTLNTTFATGDVIVFKGSARATVTGADTSDMIVRAFIKTLGYNEQQWAFQTKAEYSDFFPLTDQLQAFELSVTYPDLAVDDSLQVIQLGFEITTEFDAGAQSMDAGTIYFEGLEGYIEGDAVTQWKGYDIETDPAGWVNTGEVMGWLYVGNDPYIYSLDLDAFFYMAPEDDFTGVGNWLYIFKD